MKKFILGFFIGIAVLLVFLYLGGSRYMIIFGNKTEEAGEKLRPYEKGVQNAAKGAKKSAEKAFDKTKEKVKGYMEK